MSVQAPCPACGAPVRFTTATGLVTVCQHCRSVVARGDRQLEDLGKVADLVPTGALLRVGLKGRYQNVPFDLTGRAQLGHAAGGVWDEWYAHFADGRWGWLAEAQGRFYLTFRAAASAAELPQFDRLALGSSVTLPGAPSLTVAEKGEARAVSAEGEIPYRLVPNDTYDYADLSGPNGEFATLDYSEDVPLAFNGCEVTLDDIGLPERLKPGEAPVREVAGVQLSCPRCGGPLALRAPDRTERVGCPNCGSLLDVSEGKLRLLHALDKPQFEPQIPLGATGRLNDLALTVIGYLRRSVTLGGTDYPWDEYLLYDVRHGFRWLVCSDGHWNYVEPLSPGRVTGGAGEAFYSGDSFRLFQRATACVDYVLGEFYWKVQVGEEVESWDYVRPPLALSKEVSGGDDQGEINWSLGTYLLPDAVARAFDVKRLPDPTGIAPNQPFPYKSVYVSWAILTGAVLLLAVIVAALAPSHPVFEKTFQPTPADHVVFSDTGALELHSRRNLSVTARGSLENSWVHIDGDLINDDTGLVQPFELPLEYYHGVEEGESWSEGGHDADTHLSALPSGKYTLRLEFEWPPEAPPPQVTVRVEEGGIRASHLMLVLLVLGLPAAAVGAYHISFEKRRWDESTVSDRVDNETPAPRRTRVRRREK